MRPNRHVEKLLAQGFMQDKEEGPEPHCWQRDMASEVLMDAWGQLDLRVAEGLALPSEVATLVSALALTKIASELTPAEVLRLATGKAVLKRLAAHAAAVDAFLGGKVVEFPRKR